MARPYKVRDKRTNEIIEFEWDDPSPPTKFDIDRIVDERRSKQFELPDRSDTETGISTPRFPSSLPINPSAQLDDIKPDFRSEVVERYLPQPEPSWFDRSETPTFGGELKRVWNTATTPLMPDVEEDLFSTIGKTPVIGGALEPIARFAGEGATSPLGLLTGGVGAFALTKGAKAINAFRKGASKLDDIADVGNKLDDIPTTIAKRAAAAELDELPINKQPGAVPEAEAVLPPIKELGKIAPKLDAQLPHDLRGARPRYYMSATSQVYEPIFDNDIDKALYIVANRKKPSPRDADYIKFISENTGMSISEIEATGQQVKASLGEVLKGQKLGKNKVPRLYNPVDIQPLPSPLNVEREVTLGPFPPGENSLSKVNKGAKIDPISDISDNLDPPNMNPDMISDEGKTIASKLREKLSDKPRTTAAITGNETGKVSPLIEAAEKQKLPETGVAPAAQAEQSINEFVPKNATEAYQMAEDAELRMRKAGGDESKAKEIALQILNFPKSSWASFDLSAPLRQGKGLIHRPEYWTSLDDMFKAAWSEEEFFKIQTRIRSKELYPLMQKYNPGLVDLKSGAKALENREEALLSTWIENIPSLKSTAQAIVARDKSLLKPGAYSRLVRGSNRGYTAFLNTLRADTFENMILNYEKIGLDPYNNPKLLDNTAKFVASATGRGDLGKWNAVAQDLNALVYSPRFVKSRFDMLQKPTFSSLPMVTRKEYIKSALATTAYWATFAGMAKASGADINMDMTSTDFGKIKIGNTRVDTMAGLQQPMVAMIRFFGGESTSPTTGKTTQLGEGYRPETRIDVAINFARTKLSPFAGLAFDAAKGRTISGKSTSDELSRLDENNYLLRMMAPNLSSTMVDLYKEDPKWMMMLGIPAAFGEGIQVFDEPPPQKARKKGLSSYSYEGRKR